MKIQKQQLVEHLEGHGQEDKVQQVEQHLPDEIDTDQHADQLNKLGIDPSELGSDGGIGGKFGL